MFKSFGMQIAREGLSHDGYVDYWLNVHAPMSQGVHDLMGYVSNEVVRAGNRLAIAREDMSFGAQLDGIAQLHFATEDGLRRMAERPEVMKWFEDGPNFVGMRTGFIAEEHVLAVPRREGNPFKAIGFLACETSPEVALRRIVPEDGLVLSRLGEPTGSTNLPGLEVPDMDYALEVWGRDAEQAEAVLAALVARLEGKVRLVAAVVVHERVILLPKDHQA